MDSRRGLQMWGPMGRWLFLNWPRGSWQYDLICGLIIAGLFVLPNPPATPPAPQMDLDAVLAAIEAADAEVDSFTADITTTERIVIFDEVETESGTVSFLEPDYFRRDITSPGPSIEAIADGEITVYLPRIKQAQISSLDSAAGDEQGADIAVPGLSSSAELRAAYDIALEGVREEDGERLYEVRMVPKPDTTLAKYYQAVTLHVVEGEWHPARRIVLENFTEDTTTIELSNIVRNADLEPDDFKVELPPGTEIIRHGQTVSF